jgi:hypothetical protein
MGGWCGTVFDQRMRLEGVTEFFLLEAAWVVDFSTSLFSGWRIF